MCYHMLLYYTVLYDIVLHYILLNSIVLYFMLYYITYNMIYIYNITSVCVSGTYSQNFDSTSCLPLSHALALEPIA